MLWEAVVDISSLITQIMSAGALRKDVADRKEQMAQTEYNREKAALGTALDLRGEAAATDQLYSNANTNMDVSAVAKAATQNPNITGNQLGYNAGRIVQDDPMADSMDLAAKLKFKDMATKQAYEEKKKLLRAKLKAAGSGSGGLKKAWAGYSLANKLVERVDKQIGSGKLESVAKMKEGAILVEKLLNRQEVSWGDLSSFATNFYKSLSHDVGNITEQEADRTVYEPILNKIKRFVDSLQGGKGNIDISSKTGKMLAKAFSEALSAGSQALKESIGANYEYFKANPMYVNSSYMGKDVGKYVDDVYAITNSRLKGIDDLAGKLYSVAGYYADKMGQPLNDTKVVPMSAEETDKIISGIKIR